MQGAKRSDTGRYREHLQRRSAPVSAGQHRSDFSVSVDYRRHGGFLVWAQRAAEANGDGCTGVALIA